MNTLQITITVFTACAHGLVVRKGLTWEMGLHEPDTAEAIDHRH